MLFLVLFPLLRATLHTNADEIMDKVHMFDGSYTGPSTLKTIQIQRLSYEPRTLINTKYSTVNGSSYVIADMQFNTSSPALHLDNFIEILQIKCDNARIDLRLVDKTSALALYSEWIPYLGELVVLAGWEHRCHGNGSASTFRVNSMKLTNDHIILYDLEPLSRKSVVTTWKLNISQYGVDQSGPVEIKQPKPKARKVRRSFDDFVNEVKISAKEFNGSFLTTSLQNTLESSHFTKNNSNIFNFTTNYDTFNQKVITPDILVYDFINAIANCLNCYTTGSADIHIEMEGYLADVTMFFFLNLRFKLTMKGEMKMSLDFKITLRSLYEAPINYDLFHKAYRPVQSVEGVFSFGILIFLS
jgi:hypothetical protein